MMIPVSNVAGSSETDTISDVTITASDDVKITVAVPKHLLVGSHENYGLIVRENSDEPILVTLTADSDILELPKTVFLATDENHGLFKMHTHGTGAVQITAILDNVSYSAQTTIYNPVDDDYRIVLSAPNATGIPDVKIGVHTVDHFGNPIPVKHDTDIRFNSFNFDTLTSVVTIPEGQSSVFVSGKVHGDATISAYSEDSLSDDVKISRVHSNAAVHLGIAPEIILDYSFAYLFIWIADDAGNQIIPFLPLSATIQSSSPDTVGFAGLYQSNHKSHQKIHISDGFHMMKIYTYKPGTSTITVAIPGYGAISKDVIVGSALIRDDMDCSCVDAACLDSQNDSELENKIYHMCASVFPDTSLSDAYLVYSLFESTRFTNATLSADDGGILLSPKHSYKQDFLISSDDSVNYEKHHVFEPESKYTQSSVIPISSRDIGDHLVTITSPNYHILNTSFTVTPTKQYSFDISTIPFTKSDEVVPLFTVSIIDENAVVVDPHFLFGGVTASIITGDVTLEYNEILLRNPVSIIEGIPKIKEPSITLISDDNIMGKHHSKIDNNLQLLIDAPDTVHAGEPFAVYAYVADSSGTPIALSQSIDSNCDASPDNILFTCNSDDAEFILIEDSIGVEHRLVDVFVNSISADSILVDFGDDSEIILYDEYRIPVKSGHGVSWDVDTSIQHAVDGNDIVLYPELPGVYDVSVIFSQVGHNTVIDTRQITIHDKVGLRLSTVTAKNANFASDVSIVNLDGEHMIRTPDDVHIMRGENTITFPKNIQTESAGYVFEHILWNSDVYQSNVFSDVIYGSSNMTAKYREVINIRVVDALGSGVYNAGDLVTIHAPPRDVTSFLIRDVLDYWTVVPKQHDIHSDTISFTASESFETIAVYKQDFTGLVAVVVGVSLGVITLKHKETVIGLIFPNKNRDDSDV